MGAADVVALCIVVCGVAVLCIVVGRLLDRVERVVRLQEQHIDEVRRGFARADERIDETHRQIGALRVYDGGGGGRGRGGSDGR